MRILQTNEFDKLLLLSINAMIKTAQLMVGLPEPVNKSVVTSFSNRPINIEVREQDLNKTGEEKIKTSRSGLGSYDARPLNTERDIKDQGRNSNLGIDNLKHHAAGT